MARTQEKAPRSSIDPVRSDNQAVLDEDDIEPVEADNRPQYRLTEAAYIEDRLLEPGALVRYEGIPGHHMKPANAAAKAKCAELWPNGRPAFVDPIQSMAIVGGSANGEVPAVDKLVSVVSQQAQAVAQQTQAVNAFLGAVMKRA